MSQVQFFHDWVSDDTLTTGDLNTSYDEPTVRRDPRAARDVLRSDLRFQEENEKKKSSGDRHTGVVGTDGTLVTQGGR